MKIPEKLEVAGITYDIKEVESDCPELSYGGLVGSQYHTEQYIMLSEKLKGDVKCQVFTHEFVHAICDSLNITDETVCIDERFVESFSQLLYQVLKQL